MKSLFHGVLPFALSCLLLCSSCTSEYRFLDCGRFNYRNTREAEASNNYVLLKDGTKITGDKLETGGMISGWHAEINGTKYKFKELKGFMRRGYYYEIFNGVSYERLVQGKINIFRLQYTSDHRTHCSFYYQEGNNGKVVMFYYRKELLKLIGDCPMAYELANIKNSTLNQSLRADPNYLNKVVEIYNNGCSPINKPIVK
jgi:hypothetical protein